MHLLEQLTSKHMHVQQELGAWMCGPKALTTGAALDDKLFKLRQGQGLLARIFNALV